MSDFARVESLFDDGVDLDEAAREALLAEACADRPDLADKVRNMWKYDDEPDFDFSEMPEPDQLLIPEAIGPYKVLDLLGHGGMGAVYKAEQERPKRLVALKVMHMGLASQEYLHRFMAEQKALALMAHPNIAVVYDAGFTADNSPYFAMEYLDGVSITQWCDDEKATIRQRLQLFMQICDGVKHAHQKGVVHRDLHPDNMIVVSQDGSPVPKIIDFGIAKLENSEQDTGYRTRMGTVMGTPEYMSPEQAAGEAAETGDTRSDVYALGSVLYKLLVGVTPLGYAMKETTITQMVRIIQESVMLRPSARIDNDWQAIAVNRGCEAAVLRDTVAGDLDWVVMKALERDPDRRYSSVADFARDLECYLDGFPVSASPPSKIYQMRKFVSRNRYAVGAAAIFLFMLVAGLTSTSIALVRSLEAEEQAKTSLNRLEKVNDFYLDIFRSVDPYVHGKDVKGVELLAAAAEEVAEKYKNEPELEAETRMVLGRSLMGLSSTQEAKKQFQKAHQLYSSLYGDSYEEAIRAQDFIGYILGYYEGDFSAAKDVYAAAYVSCLKVYSESDPISLNISSRYAEALMKLDQIEEAEEIFIRTLKMQKEVLAFDSDEINRTRNHYGRLLEQKGQYKLAEPYFRRSVEIQKGKGGDSSPVLWRAMSDLARVLDSQKRTMEAIDIYKEVYPLRMFYLGAGHPETLSCATNYAIALEKLGKYDKALSVLTQSYENLYPTASMYSNVVLNAMQNIGHLKMKLGEYDEAKLILTETLGLKTKSLGPSHSSTLRTHWTYGEVLHAMGDINEAKAVYEDVVSLATSGLGESHYFTSFLANLYEEFLASENIKAESE